MGILRDFERRLGGAVEGFFARAFRSGLQPVELAKALQRYAADYQQVGLDGVFIPNVYRFDLSPEDLERFGSFRAMLEQELSEVVRRTATERNWHLQGPVRIEFERNAGVPIGTYELRGKVDAPVNAGSAPADARPEPRAEPAPAAAPRPSPPVASVLAPSQSRRAMLQLVNGPDAGRRFAIAGGAVLGRLPECDVSLDDPSVSRRHARVGRQDGVWFVEDLGSTNGTRIGERAVSRGELSDGDELRLGNVRLVFTLEP
jgi:hypothetical protein